ncbi:MAG TPA: hemerythrin domain-containing protein [Actinomycetota bacterium]|nr:hemerythrin domain-containing protein [Actinomycetota bacterium]
MDAISLLMDDHRTVEKLFGQWEALGTGDQEERRRVAREIIRELAIHAAVEEQFLYPTVRDRVPDGQNLFEQSLEEHQRVERILDELDKAEPADPGYDEKVGQLIRDVSEHVREEENDLLPKLREAVGQEDLDRVGNAMEAAKKLAPTHPHPAAPSTPPGNLVAGPAAGVVDRIRDALRGGDR